MIEYGVFFKDVDLIFFLEQMRAEFVNSFCVCMRTMCSII